MMLHLYGGCVIIILSLHFVHARNKRKRQPIGMLGRSAVATMIGCLPTQAIAFGWKPGFRRGQLGWAAFRRLWDAVAPTSSFEAGCLGILLRQGIERFCIRLRCLVYRSVWSPACRSSVSSLCGEIVFIVRPADAGWLNRMSHVF